MTADTYSNFLGFLIMGTGNDNNTWGGNANTAVFQIFEDAIANALTSSVTGGTLDLSGSPPPAAASQARYAALIFSGVLGSNQTIQVPNLRKFWYVQNATSGAFTLKFKTPSGSASIAIPQNSGWQVVQCDGANGIIVSPFNSQQIQMPDGSASAPAYSNVNETNSGWYRAGTQDWRLSINGAAVLQVTGPGASTPSVVNVLTPNLLQQNGVAVVPSWVVAGGTADVITATYSPALTALPDGLLCAFRATAANATPTPTFNPNGLGAGTITRKGGAALFPGDIPGNFAEMLLRYNLANTRWELLNPQSNVAQPPAASFKNLAIKVTDNTHATVTADAVVVSDGTNSQTISLNQSVNLGTTGAGALDQGTIAIDSFYHLWAIAKQDGTKSAVASLSSDGSNNGGLALPSGYTFKARIGAVQTIHASATLYGTWQLGRKTRYIVGLAQTGSNLPIMTTVASTSPFNALAVARFVPTTASMIAVSAYISATGAGTAGLFIAPNPNYPTTGQQVPLGMISPANLTENATVELLLESSNIYYFATGSVSSMNIACYGWDDNI